jgi:TRAP transporter TAXI family solute receptor
MGEALAKALSSRDTSYAVDLQTTEDLGTVESIQGGTSDCGFTSANIAYEAFAGRLPDDPRRYDRLRGVALVQLVPLHLLVRKGSTIHDVSDFRGRGLAIGSPGGATSRVATLVLHAYGLGRDSVQIVDEGAGKVLPLLRSGKLEGAFLLYGQTTQGRSSGPEQTEQTIQVVPLYGAPIDRLRQEYPFIRPALILAGQYPNQKDAIRTIGVETMIICRADLKPERVQDVTDAWFRATNHLLESSFMFDTVSSDLASATPIPLHEGATRYYRAKRLTQ